MDNCLFQISPKIAIPSTDIVWIQGCINYSTLYFASGRRLTLCMTLARIHKTIDQPMLRIHRSFLVNKQYIKSITREYVETTAGSCLPISRRKVSKIYKNID